MTFFDVKRILVPTDFSPASTHALDTAIAFAQRFGAEIILFHAQELPTYVFPDSVMPVSPTMFEDVNCSVRQELERLSERVRLAGVPVTSAHSIGAQDSEICRQASESAADVIIMGTHGRTGLRHALLGSVAERVVRRAPCAVLTIRPEVEPRAHL